MSFRRSLLGATLLASMFATPSLAENTFNFAFQGTLKSLDPYSQ